MRRGRSASPGVAGLAPGEGFVLVALQFPERRREARAPDEVHAAPQEVAPRRMACRRPQQTDGGDPAKIAGGPDADPVEGPRANSGSPRQQAEKALSGGTVSAMRRLAPTLLTTLAQWSQGQYTPCTADQPP